MSSPSSSPTIATAGLPEEGGLQVFFRRHRLIVSLLLVALLVDLVFFIFFFDPARSGLASDESSIEAARSRIGRLAQVRQAMDALSGIEAAFLNQESLARLADRLPAMAKRYRLALPGVSYRPEKQTAEGIRTIALEFKLEGHYRNVRRFIHAVERMEQFLFIDDMEFTSAGRDSNRLDLRVRMIAVTS